MDSVNRNSTKEGSLNAASKSRRGGRLRWLILGATILLLAEGIARIAPYSAPRYSSFLHYQQVFVPALRPGTTPAGNPVLMTTDPRIPVQWVPTDKAAGTLRVLCFGGSATAGLGHSPNVTFVRHLEELLIQAYPERNIEVVNLGVVAISSKQVSEMVEDAIENADPDLMIVYSGNNEFLETHALRFAQIHGGIKGKLQRGLRQSALVRTIEQLAKGPATPTELPDRRPSTDSGASRALTEAQIIEDVHLTADDLDAGIERYVGALANVAQSAQDAKIPLVVCTVAANWEWSGKKERKYSWSGVTDLAVLEQRAVELEAVDWEGKENDKQLWLQIVEAADLQVALGNPQAAGQLYQSALQADPHLRRATTRQGDILKGELRRMGAPTFDATEFFLSRSPKPWIGFDVFYDYVHFTPYGAALMAEGLVEFLQADNLLPSIAGSLLQNTGSDPQDAAVFGRGHANAYRSKVENQVQNPTQPDFLDAGQFLGIGFDPERLHSTDLWKYEAMAIDLDARITSRPEDPIAWIYRGNRRFYQQGQASNALSDWKRALELGGPRETLEPAIQAMKDRPSLKNSDS